MLERPLDFWDSWSMTLNLTVLERGLLNKLVKLQKVPALANSDNITFLNFEARRAVSGDVAVSLLITMHYNRPTQEDLYRLYFLTYLR